MSEVLACDCDDRSSRCEKDSVYAMFFSVVEVLRFIHEKVPEDSHMFKDLVVKYKPAIDILEQAMCRYCKFPEYLEVRYDSHEVISLLKKEFDKKYESSCSALMSQLDVVFPDNLAKVNVPGYCDVKGVKIPRVEKFQHDNSLPPDFADSEYMKFTSDAKRVVADRINENGGASLPEDFELSQPEYNPVREDIDRLSGLLESFLDLKRSDIDAVFTDEVDTRMRGVMDFFNYERDLELVKEILNCVEEMKIPNEESLVCEYTEIIVRENISEVQKFAESMAKEHLSEALGDALRVLSEKLNSYEVTPKLAAESLNRARKRKRKRNKQSRQDNCEVSEQDVQAVEVNLKVGDYIELSHETFPWLDKEVAKVLYIKRSGNDVTVVVDARTEAAKRIEHRMSGYETKKKQERILSILYDKLKLAAEIVATSDSGLRDSWTTLRHRDKNKYPFSIFSWKNKSSDALRMYVSYIAVGEVDNESVREMLKDNGITHLLMLLGVCDKNNQEELLPVFTGRTRRVEAADGAGA